MTLAASFAWWEIPVGLAGGLLVVWLFRRYMIRRFDLDPVELLTEAFIDWAKRVEDRASVRQRTIDQLDAAEQRWIKEVHQLDDHDQRGGRS